MDQFAAPDANDPLWVIQGHVSEPQRSGRAGGGG